MRAAPLLVPAVLAFLAPAPGPGQQADDRPPPRAYLGGNLQLSHPVGEFGDSIGTGLGVDAHFLYRLDPGGVLGLRVDGGFVQYGSEERPVLLSPAVGGRITLDLNTSHTIAFLGAGPQLLLPTGALRPYLNATGGLAYFSTVSSLEGWQGEQLAHTTNFDDLALSYGAGAGVYVPLRVGRRPVSLDVGVRYRAAPDARYLREGSIRDLPDGRIAFTPVEGDADLFAFHVGGTIGLRKHRDRCGARC